MVLPGVQRRQATDQQGPMILPCKLTPRAKFHWGRSPILVSPRSGGQVLVVPGTLVQSIGTPAWPISNISISFSWGSKQSNRCRPRILAHFYFWFSLGSPVATGPLPGHDSSRSSIAVQVGPATKIRVVPSCPSTLCRVLPLRDPRPTSRADGIHTETHNQRNAPNRHPAPTP